MKRRNLLALGLGLVPGVAGLAACSGPSASSGSATDTTPSKIVYYGGWTGSDLDKMQAMVTKYNASQSKVQVEFSSLQWTNMFTKFLADYQAGNSPDVVAMHTFEIGQFADMGVLDSGAVGDLGLKKDDFLPIAWDGSSYNKKQYGVPLDVNMHAVYYNKDMFAKAGISSFPTDKASFLAAAQKLTVDTNGKHPTDSGFNPQSVQTYGLGFSMNHHAFYQVFALMNQDGYNPFTADMKSISLDTAKTAPAINVLEDLIFNQKVVPVGEKSPIDDFKAGKVAMVVDGNWQLSGFSAVKFAWDTAPYPQMGAQKAVWGASEVITIPVQAKKDAKKAAAVKDFVTWLAQNSAEWAKSGQIPANKASYNAMTKLPGIDAYISELDYVKFLPAHPQATKIFSSAAPSPILTFAQDVVLNDKPAATVVPKLQDDINAVLKK
ncbi:MAG: extracellular solute-binding protein [Actinobacteria bacterium]|nr:extracellular solute-binding protein [Actinomycetota bacterium]